jgi:Ca2+-binding RTX toxin-like protein
VIARRLIVLAVAAIVAALVPAVGGTAHVGAASPVLDLYGSDEDDRIEITCVSGEVLVTGATPAPGATPCHDVRRIQVRASAGDDVIDLGGVGPESFDQLRSTALRAGPGDDRVVGSWRPDGVIGGNGVETVLGRDGVDRFDAGVGSATFRGGAGKDVVRVHGSGRWTIDDDRISRLTGSRTRVEIWSVRVVGWAGGRRPDVVDARRFHGSASLFGSVGQDLIRGGRGPDWISGGSSPDVIFGGPGADEIIGLYGEDRLMGGPGNDELGGGGGVDRCAGGPGDDEIFDCEP